MKSLDDYKSEYETDIKLHRIKLIFATVLLVFAIGVCICTGCNMNVIDLTYSYNYAYIKLQNGEVIEGPVSSWRDYEDGDQLQVTIDGVTYLVHASNCTLVYYGEQV